MSTCATCGGRFVWQRQGSKWHAVNADGSNHWAGCLGRRKEHASKRAEVIAGRTITGPNYVPSCGCEIPPWVECACSRLLQGAAA